MRADTKSDRWATVIGYADATTVDHDGVPVVIEVKTGGGPESTVESDLYAVGIARWMTARDRPFDAVRVHRHRVSLDEAVCDRTEFSTSEIADAAERLEQLVAPVLSWPWEDPLAPDFSVDAWCADCEFRSTCEAFRTVVDLDAPAFE